MALSLSAFSIALVFLGCSLGSSLIGMVLHVGLPADYLDTKSRNAVKQVMGLIATLSALVLGLLVSSAHAHYDRQNVELKAFSANVILLDRTLGLFGPDAKAARDGLRDVVTQTLDRIWSPEGVQPENLNSTEMQDAIRDNIVRMESLTPKTDVERVTQRRVLRQMETVSQQRLLIFEQVGDSIPWPFLTILTFWISILFFGFGLLSRFDGTVTVALLLGALSVTGAIFLILELSDPYHGLVRVSDEPLRNALIQIDP